MPNTKWTALVALAVLAGGFATDALAGEGRRGEGRRGGGRRGAFVERGRERARDRMTDRREKSAKFLASLEVTDEQRRVVLDKARAAAPIVSGAKDEARRIVARAWAAAAKDPAADRTALRDSVKSELKALKERTRAALAPLATDVVGSITPEQRAKIEARNERRTRPLDDSRMDKFARRLIARPMTVPYLEERLGR